MSLLSGNVTLKRFLVLGQVPTDDHIQQCLESDRYRPFEDGSEEERIGWCDWRNLYTVPPEAEWVRQDKFAVFGLRLDSRKVPAAALQAKVDLRIRDLMKERDLAFIGKEARISIQDEVKAELLRKIFPTPKMFEVAWNLKEGELWTTASSSKAQSALIGLFMKSFALELQPLVPLHLAGRVGNRYAPEKLMSLDPMELAFAGEEE